ncbi:MAG: exodeoxyribonuclease VII small subunit [Verrucomicrobiota bacterium]|nr:exodeoxyribonuclease VII small subunit [Verrucomicrobiota bacterium]
MPRNNKATKKQELRFEEAMENLESIIDRMETERIPLDDLLKEYEEGTKLLKLCRDRIENARARIDQINKDLGSAENCLSPLDEHDSESHEGGKADPQTSNEGIQLL